MRRLASLALIALVAACEAPVDDTATPAAELPDTDANAFRAEGREEERAYAGEWAIDSNACNNQREIWTIEQTRMGMKRERFCHFERINQSAGDNGQVWSASARCVARGRFLLLRSPSQGQGHLFGDKAQYRSPRGPTVNWICLSLHQSSKFAGSFPLDDRPSTCVSIACNASAPCQISLLLLVKASL